MLGYGIQAVPWPERPLQPHGKGREAQQIVRKDPMAQVMCWCQGQVVLVPWAAIRAGQTASCGQPGCAEGAV